MTQQTIDELRRLEGDATEGEWRGPTEEESRYWHGHLFKHGGFVSTWDEAKTDLKLICAMRNSLIRLLDELESLRNQKRCTCPTHQRGCELSLLGNPEK